MISDSASLILVVKITTMTRWVEADAVNDGSNGEAGEADHTSGDGDQVAE